jgi:hypothetical protein
VAGLAIYLDECVDHGVIPHLERRGHTVTTAQGQGTAADDDEEQLHHAAAAGWIVLSTNRGHFHRLHRQFREHGEPHSGIITVPQDDQHPDRFFLRCAMIAAWITTTFDTSHNRLFRWTDLQQALQQGLRLPGFTNAEVARALGGQAGADRDRSDK